MSGPEIARECTHWVGAEQRRCHATEGVRAFLTGPRCPEHTPSALAGRPEPQPGPGALPGAWTTPSPTDDAGVRDQQEREWDVSPAKIVLHEGQRFGRLTIIGEAGRAASGKVLYTCRCDCGTETVKRGAEVKRGHITSCGCAQLEQAAKLNRKHGQYESPLYRRWAAMIQRTTNPNNDRYADYGGRGIGVCPEWRASFEAFARDMAPGFAPELELDRIDNSLGYSKSNCRWVPRVSNQRNKRSNRLLTLGGQSRPVVEWAEVLGLNNRTIAQRIDRYGWSVERALTVGVDPRVLDQLGVGGPTGGSRLRSLPGIRLDPGQPDGRGGWIRIPTADYVCPACGETESASGDQVAHFAAHIETEHRERCTATNNKSGGALPGTAAPHTESSNP